MRAIMLSDHREETGWCIVQEVKETDTEDKPINAYWVMNNIQCNYWKYWCYSEQDDDEWFAHAKFNTYQKAIKRMELIENGTIEPW